MGKRGNLIPPMSGLSKSGRSRRNVDLEGPFDCVNPDKPSACDSLVGSSSDELVRVK